MKLSASLIVRNESQMLPACLESIKGMDEIVVVDTGSSDNTVEIAESFGAKVYFYKWNDDFAAARNESLKHCTGDWVLIVDADEVLTTPIDRDLLQGDAMLLLGVSDTESSPILRLFKNSPYMHWEGAIHNEIVGATDIRVSPFRIRCGHSPNHQRNPERTIRILRKMIASGERVHLNNYYAGIELLRLERYRESIEYLTEYIQKETAPMNLAEAWFILALNHINLKSYHDAMKSAIMATKCVPGYKAAWAIVCNLSSDRTKVEKFYHAANNAGVKIHRPEFEQLHK